MAKARKHLQIVDRLELDQALEILRKEGWQTMPPSATQQQDNPGTWHICNPGDLLADGSQNIIGTRAANVVNVIKPGGVCRAYHRPAPAHPAPKDVAEQLTSYLIVEISQLPSLNGVVALDDVLQVLGRLIPAEKPQEIKEKADDPSAQE